MSTHNLERLRKEFNFEPAEKEAIKAQMMREVRAYELKELRKETGLTQKEVAEKIGVSQRQVSKIETGDLENTKIETIRKYLEALGGSLSVEYVLGDKRVKVAY